MTCSVIAFTHNNYLCKSVSLKSFFRMCTTEDFSWMKGEHYMELYVFIFKNIPSNVWVKLKLNTKYYLEVKINCFPLLNIWLLKSFPFALEGKAALCLPASPPCTYTKTQIIICNRSIINCNTVPVCLPDVIPIGCALQSWWSWREKQTPCK